MKIQSVLDKTAIGLSALCAIHCLVLPVTLILVSLSIPVAMDNEAFHRALLWCTIPISLFAIVMGCKKHSQSKVYIFAGLGLFLLAFASFFGHDLMGEIGEKGLTLLGGILLITGHVMNYRACKSLDCASD